MTIIVYFRGAFRAATRGRTLVLAALVLLAVRRLFNNGTNGFFEGALTVEISSLPSEPWVIVPCFEGGFRADVAVDDAFLVPELGEQSRRRLFGLAREIARILIVRLVLSHFRSHLRTVDQNWRKYRFTRSAVSRCTQ